MEVFVVHVVFCPVVSILWSSCLFNTIVSIFRLSDPTRTELFNLNMTSFSSKEALTHEDKYGPNSGIYIHKDQEIARTQCFTGNDYFVDEYAMNAEINYAFEYDCSILAPCESLIVG